MNSPGRLQVWPEAIEYLAMGGIFVALIALSLIRIDMTDTPWHLATAKYAFSEGRWPIHNTFSYTYPDYPLHQQYPIYQTILYMTYQAGGWAGLSVLHCLVWIGIFLLWLGWASPGSRQMKALSLAWMLGLLGLQRRMILRPDLISILLFIFLLHLFDLYRRGRSWAAGFFVVVQWFLVNSHQLFPLGLGFQGLFLGHLIIVRKFGGRYGIAETDSALPLLPVALAMGGSILVCFGSPLGTDIVYVLSHTASSLYHHGKHVQEFAPFYSDGYSFMLVLFASALGFIGIYRQRSHWQPFEIGLWFTGVVVLSAAIRGVALYVLICVGVFGRSFARNEVSERYTVDEDASGKRAQIMFRTFCATLTLFMCAEIVYSRWVTPSRILGGTQPGIGLSLGVWPVETIKFLKENPPPGRMINLSWYSGNPLILELFPRYHVFVDPRFESYPRDFLLQAIEAERSRGAIEGLISRYQPDWMVVEVGNRDLRKLAIELVRDKSWEIVHADTVLLTLVRNVPRNASYLAIHRLTPENIAPRDFLTSEPDLKALQQLVMAGLYKDLGLHSRAREMIQAAESVAGSFGVVQDALQKIKEEDSREGKVN
jgi:hypothetical protein